MNPSQLLALDVGKKRTGIARASAVAKIAEPLMSVETDKLLGCLKKLITEYSIDGLVIGLPRSLNGEDTDQTRWTRQWAEALKPQLKAEIYWQDEALTTQTAEAWVKDKKGGHDIVAHAAAVIMDDFLKTPPKDRQPC